MRSTTTFAGTGYTLCTKKGGKRHQELFRYQERFHNENTLKGQNGRAQRELLS